MLLTKQLDTNLNLFSKIILNHTIGILVELIHIILARDSGSFKPLHKMCMHFYTLCNGLNDILYKL